jgi:transcriptional regulator with XRE-family HTH domain
MRAQSGYTQAELSKKLSMGRAYLGRLERGEILPRYITLVRLAACLGISTEDLVRIDVKPKVKGSNDPK